MKKHIVSIALLVCGIFLFNSAATGSESAVPDRFKRFDPNSKLKIDYTDVSSLFDAVVLKTGRSNRTKASSAQSQTGTRMKITINRSTVNEGNRFYFEVFENSAQNQQTLQNIRNRLENIPAAMPLEKFSRDEQLAYWLNLYNITILDEIVKLYPERELEDQLVGRKSFLSKKVLTIAGVPLSLNDIQFTILKQNYDNDPVVIYGMFQGIIGGPNIRKSAYTGKHVYGDLIDNAMEFINSNRGTDTKSERVFRVSSLYERNAVFFPDFETDLTGHLLTYLEGEQRGELRTATKIQADIDDWTITDLYGSDRNLGGSLANSNVALGTTGVTSKMTSKASTSRYTPAVTQRLNELNQKRIEERTGVVTVEELGQSSENAEAGNSVDKEGK